MRPLVDLKVYFLFTIIYFLLGEKKIKLKIYYKLGSGQFLRPNLNVFLRNVISPRVNFENLIFTVILRKLTSELGLGKTQNTIHVGKRRAEKERTGYLRAVVDSLQDGGEVGTVFRAVLPALGHDTVAMSK